VEGMRREGVKKDPLEGELVERLEFLIDIGGRKPGGMGQLGGWF